jgi:hypothetical protein
MAMPFRSAGAKVKVLFATVRRHFLDPDSVGLDELYQSIGYPENITNGNFANTCAIRLSLALLGAGFPNPGLYPVKAGKYKGRMIETQQRKLSNFLVRQLGQPEKYKNGQAAEKAVGARHGIISFFQLHGPEDRQGHIAIVAVGKWDVVRCGLESEYSPTNCYWSSVDTWFWPLT